MSSSSNINGDNGAGRQVSMKVDLPSNSHKAKENLPSSTSKLQKPVEAKPERVKLERIVTGEVIRKKKSVWSRIAETFTGDDARSVGDYVFFDVIVPGIKSMLYDTATQGLERTLFGSSSSRSRPKGRERNHTPYSRMSMGNSRDRDEPRSLSRRDRAQHNFDTIIIDSRQEAEQILDGLAEQVHEYGCALLTDLYEAVGISGSFADDKWGWYSAKEFGVRPVREGFLLLLPKPELIE